MERRRFGKVGGDLSRRIDEAVRRARKNEEWRSEYMKELLHDDDVREEGREEGRIRQAKVTALKLQKKGYSIEDIAECVDFDEETVKKWLVS